MYFYYMQQQQQQHVSVGHLIMDHLLALISLFSSFASTSTTVLADIFQCWSIFTQMSRDVES